MVNKNESVKANINEPLIFTKKIKNNTRIIPLSFTKYPLGPNKHFPVATKEWSNSIYTYNKNSSNNLTIANNTVTQILKSYFSLYFNNKFIDDIRIKTRFRRLDTDKIFLGKPEFKHTNNKVIVNLYVFNQQKFNLTRKLNMFESKLFPTSGYLSIKETDKTFVSISEKLLLNEINKVSIVKYLKELLVKVNIEIKLEENNLSLIRKKKFLKLSKLNLDNLKNFSEKLENVLFELNSLLSSKLDNKEINNIYLNFARKTILEKEIDAISKYKLLLNLNRSKFENNFILKLKNFISKIYNKQVELNIINLKSLYLDISMVTEAIGKKLKNRDNTVLRVLRTFLLLVKLPKINSVREKYGKSFSNKVWINKIKDLDLNSFIFKNKNGKDGLNKLLLDIVPDPNKKVENDIISKVPLLKRESTITKEIQDIVFKSLKYKNVGGIRLEAKGRLTRRFTAARSIFKVKWKGSLKNIDSSYRGMSSTILRGHVKSNVEYSHSSNYNRIGAFGIKGWISGK